MFSKKNVNKNPVMDLIFRLFNVLISINDIVTMVIKEEEAEEEGNEKERV